MQKLFDYAAVKIGFRETHAMVYPELVIGSAPGMPLAAGWVYRLHSHFTVATGTPAEISRSFERSPVRALDSDVLHRHPVGSAWIIEALELRLYEHSLLQRVVALGQQGEASILFEGYKISPDTIVALQKLAVTRSLREVVEAIASPEESAFTQEAKPYGG